MDTALIARYQAGGDLYQKIVLEYGQPAADAIADAAATGDQDLVNTAFANYTTGGKLLPDSATSTLDNFVSQIVTDPLAAPLASANTLLGNTFFSFLKNPWVLLTIAAVIFFFVFDGINVIKGLLKKK